MRRRAAFFIFGRMDPGQMTDRSQKMTEQAKNRIFDCCSAIMIL